jgi:SagB-type dehydrogenase family enzyme
MNNRETLAARNYHDGTKHSVARLRADSHYLDWDIKPLAFKVYPHIDAIPLPRELTPSPLPALEAIGRVGTPADHTSPRLDLSVLARILHFSAGITRKKTYPGGQEHYFRAAACTGALYHIDLYVFSGDLPDLPAGVYHFGPHDFSLYQLRVGDHRAALVAATAGEPSVAHAPVVIACASTYWRNAWKYRARAYRHCFWDAGTMLANLFAVAAADDVPATLACGFVDDALSRLIGLDPRREGPLALVSLGHQSEPIEGPPPDAPELSLETLPLSLSEVDYPAIREMQAASSLHAADEVRAWRTAGVPSLAAPADHRLTSLQPISTAAAPRDRIDTVILRRGSTRQFARSSIRFDQLSTIIDVATRGIPTDCGGSMNDVYIIVNAVDGLAPGTYVYQRQLSALELLRAGEFRREAGHLDLGQDLSRDASVNIYFLCDLESVLERFGNRGYRIAQLDAAIQAGKMYLAAYAMRLGATGLTFFDDDVTNFFSPHAAGKSVMFLVAIGQADRQSLPTA